MTIPCRWAEGGLGPFNGRVRFTRRFQWPGRLESPERLWLVLGSVDYYATVWLNGELLGGHEDPFESFAFDITSPVQSRNELVVEVDLPAEGGTLSRMARSGLPSGSGGLCGEVALEVRLAQ